MESDLQYQHHQKQMNTGLTRYQSAPSSYFSNILDRDFCEELLRPTSPETERIFARFLANSGAGNTENIPNQSFVSAEIKQDSEEDMVMATAPISNSDSRLNQNLNQNQQAEQKQSNNYSSVSQQGFFQNNLMKPPLPDQNSGPGGGGGDYRMGNSLAGAGRLPPATTTKSSNLVRHSSSPAGLFSNISIEMENGYAVMRGMGDYGTVKREASYSSSASAATAIRPPAPAPLAASSGGRMSTMSEIGNKSNNIGENSSDNNNCVYDESRSNNDYVTGFPIGSWDDNASSSVMSQRLTDDDRTLSGLNASENQNRDSGIPPPPRLSHHLSLPKTAAEMSAIEKFLQLQDSVPCKIRAKRGFATHPRSIAERVRRTRISERMRKLQDLVPNMDKQTNTSDMLDLAVDYIKELQKQVKTLNENRANCTCKNIKQQQQF